MSELNPSKKMKQMRLPFAPLTSPSAPPAAASKSVESATPRTPTTTFTSSRKRKPSTDFEIGRSNKIGRTSSKENIATEHECVEILDSNDGVEEKDPVSLDGEATSISNPESDGPPLHIKLPSCSKKKLNLDLKQPQKPIEEDDDPDSSIVYIDTVEIMQSQKKKSSKKSARKSEKKKKKSTPAAMGNVDVVKKLLMENLEELSPAVKVVEDDVVEIIDLDDQQSREKSEMSTISSRGCSPKSFDTIPSAKVSPLKEDEVQEDFNDDIADVLTDFSEDLNGSFNTSGRDENGKSLRKPFDITKLTPKQLARRHEFEVRRLEKERKKQEERDQREQQRLKEKEMREEAKRIEKEEKEGLRRKEKEDRDRKKQAEIEKKEQERKMKEDERKRLIDQKEEEKRQKEEERKRQVEQREEEKRLKEEEKKRQAELREEERRQKEEEKRRKEQEDENRKKKAAVAFSKFFVPKKKDKTVQIDDEGSKEGSEASDIAVTSNFMPFQIRDRMKIAPLVRVQFTKKQRDNFDKYFHENSPTRSYVEELKLGKRIPLKGGRTWQLDRDEDEVVVVDELEGVGEFIPIDEAKMKTTLKAKLFSFHENRRPAYFGTWQKRTDAVKARNPFAKDDKFFDYDVDSDDEWEEEEPGESLHGSDSEKEKEKEEEDDYVIDNDFMVPHGHLSDEEIKQMDDDDEDNSPEIQKAKMKIMQQEFAEEMKKKTERIKPRLIGCIWMNGDEDENGASFVNQEKTYHCSDIIWRILKAREAWNVEASIDFIQEKIEPEVDESDESNNDKTKVAKTPQAKQPMKAKFNDSIIRQLIRLLHGNVNGKKFIIKEFQAYRLKNYHKEPDFLEFSVKSIEEKILEISERKSCPDEGLMFGKKCWYVKQEIRQELFGDEQMKMPNDWKYILEKEKKMKPVNTEGKSPPEEVEKTAGGSTTTTPKSAAKKRTSLIINDLLAVPVDSKSKFLKRKSPQDNKFAESSNKQTATQSLSSQPPQKKRVQLLMSVPLGESVNEKQKNQIMSQFLKKSSTKPSSTESTANVAAATKAE